MPGRAAGLRARPSAAAAVAFAWPRPQTAEAIAIAKPEVMATQLVAEAAAPPWAKTGTAKHIMAIAIKTKLSVLRIVVFSFRNCRQWVVDVILVQTPSR